MLRLVLALLLVLAPTAIWSDGVSSPALAADRPHAAVEADGRDPVPAGNDTASAATATTEMPGGCGKSSHSAPGASCIVATLSEGPSYVVAQRGHRSVWRAAMNRLDGKPVASPLRPPILRA
jgi:L-aminopeptidase/D-esterase-like protein